MTTHHSTCLTPTCSRPSRTRGLCISCYVAASRLIKSGETTWSELESLGMAKAAGEGDAGSKGKGQFSRLYRERRQRRGVGPLDRLLDLVMGSVN